MNLNFKEAFFLSTLAGLSTLIGSIIIFLKQKKKDKLLIEALSFAASIMIFICFFDLIPQGFNFLNNNFNTTYVILIMFFFIVVGINISISIDKLVEEKQTNNKVYRVGIISMIAIILHNIPEGMATFITTNSNIKMGILFAISIALHNIPEGMSIALPIYYSSNSKRKAFLYTFISGLSEPLGAIMAYFILTPFINNITLGVLYFIISGIMFQISFFELLPTSLSFRNYKRTIISFIIGIIIVLLTRIII